MTLHLVIEGLTFHTHTYPSKCAFRGPVSNPIFFCQMPRHNPFHLLSDDWKSFQNKTTGRHSCNPHHRNPCPSVFPSPKLPIGLPISLANYDQEDGDRIHDDDGNGDGDFDEGGGCHYRIGSNWQLLIFTFFTNPYVFKCPTVTKLFHIREPEFISAVIMLHIAESRVQCWWVAHWSDRKGTPTETKKENEGMWGRSDL